MRCKDCRKRTNERVQRPHGSRRRRAATCDRCGAPILPLPDDALGAGDGTLAHLKRFGLAINGDPLLELKREGI
jgi:hypothetical protein